MTDIFANEKQVRIAADLYRMRDTARRLLGDKYKPYMDELGKIIADIAMRNKTGTIEAAIAHCKKRQLVGMELMLTMAAVVELAEPTP